MDLREDSVDIIVPFFPSEKGLARLADLKESLKNVDPGFPYRLIVAEGKKPCVQNRNDGLKQSDTRYFVMCDDDVIFIEENWLKKAVDIIKTQEKIGAVGFCITDKRDEVINSGRYFVKQNDDMDLYFNIDAREIDDHPYGDTTSKALVAGCCVLYDRTIAGYFPEVIYPDKVNCEDNDYQLMIQANGFKLYYMGTTKVIHNEVSWDEKVQKYNIQESGKNHAIFARRWNVRTGTLKG